MNVDIYNSTKHKLKFLVVKAGEVVSGENLGLTDHDFSSIAEFKKNVTLAPGLIGMDVKEAEHSINTIGYYIFGAKIEISIS